MYTLDDKKLEITDIMENAKVMDEITKVDFCIIIDITINYKIKRRLKNVMKYVIDTLYLL